ncbi:copper-binding protein [Rhodothermus sp. AH-315-K08]|nr:copper-binding protein [Rhodothermus sp. AH-315-K08]
MRLLPLTTGFFLAMGLIGCSSPETDNSEATESSMAQMAATDDHDAGANEPSEGAADGSAAAGETRTYQGAGRVRTLTPSGDFVIIEHGPIEDFMGGMTMPFPVKSDSVLRGVAIGDSIRFTLAVNEAEAWIAEVILVN